MRSNRNVGEIGRGSSLSRGLREDDRFLAAFEREQEQVSKTGGGNKEGQRSGLLVKKPSYQQWHDRTPRYGHAHKAAKFIDALGSFLNSNREEHGPYIGEAQARSYNSGERQSL